MRCIKINAKKRERTSLLLILISNVFGKLGEESTAEIPSDHIKLTLALLEFIDERLCLSCLLNQLVSFVNDFFEFYNIINRKYAYQVSTWDTFWHPQSRHMCRENCGRTWSEWWAVQVYPRTARSPWCWIGGLVSWSQRSHFASSRYAPCFHRPFSCSS